MHRFKIIYEIGGKQKAWVVDCDTLIQALNAWHFLYKGTEALIGVYREKSEWESII